MATKYFKFTGPCKWAKVTKPDDKYNVYSINVYLNDEMLAKYAKSGMQMQIKEDEDGSYVAFRRPVQKIIKGELVELGPPRVSYKGGDLENLIGNGSIVEVDVAVYDSLKGKGHTLQEVKVKELVIYERPTD